MARYKQGCQRTSRGKKPLDGPQLRELALAYVARYATSTEKLARYLRRKIAERGWADDVGTANVEQLVERYAELGYVDDESFARARSGSLLRRGYGARRVRQALGQDGIAEHIRDDVAASGAELRHAALVFARRRRLGPFGSEPPDRELREKQIAAMMRAGHDLDSAREMVDAASEAAALEWAHELDGDEPYEGH